MKQSHIELEHVTADPALLDVLHVQFPAEYAHWLSLKDFTMPNDPLRLRALELAVPGMDAGDGAETVARAERFYAFLTGVSVSRSGSGAKSRRSSSKPRPSAPRKRR